MRSCDVVGLKAFGTRRNSNLRPQQKEDNILLTAAKQQHTRIRLTNNNIMKTIILLTALAAIAIALPISSYNVAPNFSTPGVGWAFSGAGARIAQQAALAQALLFGKYPNGTIIVPAYVSGTSSGSLSAVGLNGYLEYVASNGSRGWSLSSWNNFIFGLRDSSVYRTGIRGVVDSAKGLTDGFLLDNTPLITTLTTALNQLGYSTLGDLFLPTYISTVDQRSGNVVRFLSTDRNVSSIPLIQILLASTAIPVAFPPRKIPALTNNTLFVDGGVSIDYLPVIPLLSGALPVTTVYGFTPNKDADTGSNNADQSSIEDNGIVRNTLKAFEIQGNNLLTGDLAILAASNARGYLYSAVLNQTFSTLNFNNEQEQYNLVAAWAANNNPTPVSDDRLAYTFGSVSPSAFSVNNGYADASTTGSAASITLGFMMIASIVLLL
ncbi:hypothetical protein PROFUN_11116 [Planoprotostelium fungivorum]|nr:hypothetical protein PROFUN_11116 [Planoprotostelium fungivorum]